MSSPVLVALYMFSMGKAEPSPYSKTLERAGMSWVVVTSTFTQFGLEWDSTDVLLLLPANSPPLHWWPTWSWWAPGLWAPASATGRWEPPSPSSAEATPLASGCPANLLGRAKRQLNPTMTAVRRCAPVALQIPPCLSRNTAATGNCPIWQKL